MKIFDLMKTIDQFLFENIEKLKVYDQFQEFVENFNNWEEKHQEIFKGVLLGSIFVIPGFILLIFFMINGSSQSKLDTKYEILKVASKITSQKNEVIKLSTKYLGSPISTKTMLDTQIKGSLGSINIDSTKVTLTSFDNIDEDGLNKITSDIKFKDLSSQNLFGFLRLLTITKKMRIEEIDIKKNTTTNLLEGLITIFHYSKLNDSEDDE